MISTVNIFAHDTSIFFIVNDGNISADELNKDLQNTSEWTYKLKMPVNPDFKK